MSRRRCHAGQKNQFAAASMFYTIARHLKVLSVCGNSCCESSDVVWAEPGPVFFSCDDYGSLHVPEFANHLHCSRVLGEVHNGVLNTLFGQRPVGRIALDTLWLAVDGDAHLMLLFAGVHCIFPTKFGGFWMLLKKFLAINHDHGNHYT